MYDKQTDLPLPQVDSHEPFSGVEMHEAIQAAPIEGLHYAFDTIDQANESGFTDRVVIGSDLLQPLPSGKSTLKTKVDEYGVENLASVRRTHEDGTDSNIYEILGRPGQTAPKRSLMNRLLSAVALR